MKLSPDRATCFHSHSLIKIQQYEWSLNHESNHVTPLLRPPTALHCSWKKSIFLDSSAWSHCCCLPLTPSFLLLSPPFSTCQMYWPFFFPLNMSYLFMPQNLELAASSSWKILPLSSHDWLHFVVIILHLQVFAPPLGKGWGIGLGGWQRKQ